MEKHSTSLSELEAKLSDAAIYEQDKKAELTECLKKQTEQKSVLEEVEMEWMDLQEQLENMTNEFEAG
jgi:ATP-binding cassette subfamily F protein 3